MFYKQKARNSELRIPCLILLCTYFCSNSFVTENVAASLSRIHLDGA